MSLRYSLRYAYALATRGYRYRCKPAPKRRYFPTVIISDVHLFGVDNKSIDLLAEFLNYIKCDTLVLNGDFIDGERIDRRKPKEFTPAQKQVFMALQKRVKEGARVIYIPGNHDHKLRGFLSTLSERSPFEGIEFKKEFEVIDNKQRKLLVMHGDDFDPTLQTISGLKRFRKLWDMTYVAWLKASAMVDKFSHKYLRTHFGVASGSKKAGAAVIRIFERFEQKAIDYAKSRGYDGIIIGHFHVDRKRELEDGFVLMNTGDWLESFTAVTVDENGELGHIRWAKERLKLGLPARQHFNHQNTQPDAQVNKALRYTRKLWPGRVDRPLVGLKS